jgi:caa(3)-type oxidase subunit IV
MADNLEEIQKSVKKYLVIGGLLLVFTALTVGLSYVELPTHGMNILVGMILAAIKASLVALIFMHLNHEKSIIYKVLLFTVILVSVLFILFYMTHGDPLIFEGFDKTSIKPH